MTRYKNVKYPSLLLLPLVMSLEALGATAVSASQTVTILESGGVVPPKRARSAQVVGKRELLLEHLPLQIEAVQKLQGKFQSEIDSQRETNQLAAFRAACGLANLQSFSAAIQDVLSCLRSADQSMVYIGIGAAPALKPGMDQIVVYLGESGGQIDSFKALAAEFQKIIGDIPNPEFPADSIL